MGLINDLIQFISGTKALASEINQNFESLRTGHNDQENRISSIENTYIKKDGSVLFTNNVNINNNKIVGVSDGSDTNDAINKGQLDTHAARTHGEQLRQVVLTGRAIGAGYANYIEGGSGYSAKLKADSTNKFIATIANGFNQNNIDDNYRIYLTADQTFSYLSANSTNYLYIDRNSSTGVLTYGHTTLVPAYSRFTPGSPAVDQHWFDLANYQMKVYNGSSWDIKQRLFVGEAVTDSITVITSVSYALQGKYDTGWFSVAANTNYNKNHSVGISVPDGLDVRFYFSLDVNGVDASFAHDYYTSYISSANKGFGHFIREDAVNTTRNFVNFGFLDNVQIYRNTARTSGYYRVVVTRTW